MFKICNKFSNLLKFQNSKGLFENTKCSKGFKSLKDHENVDKKNFKLFKILMRGLDWFWKEY